MSEDLEALSEHYVNLKKIALKNNTHIYYDAKSLIKVFVNCIRFFRKTYSNFWNTLNLWLQILELFGIWLLTRFQKFSRS